MTLVICNINLLPKRYLISLFTLSPLCFYSVFFSVSTSWIVNPVEQSSFLYLCCMLHRAHFGQQTSILARNSKEQSLMLHNFILGWR